MTKPPGLQPPVWTAKELTKDLEISIEKFRKSRLEEPLEAYLEAMDEARGDVEELLESTVDLADLSEKAKEILANAKQLRALRYLSGPPVSKDDLETLVDSKVSAAAVARDPKLPALVVSTLRDGFDRNRFPWLAEEREPTESEKYAAILATAALMASQETATIRRTLGKTEQEAAVRTALLGAGLKEVKRREITTFSDAPGPGTFCLESELGTRKADIIVGLWDARVLPIECKVSNSGTNSVKRLNNDAAVKAVHWRKEFGDKQVIPVAVLSGVYKLKNLEQAQERGLSIVWAHGLEVLLDFIEKTRPLKRKGA